MHRQPTIFIRRNCQFSLNREYNFSSFQGISQLRTPIRGSGASASRQYPHKLFCPMAGAYVENCIFCKIIKSEEPSENIYEDDDIICIKDINPASTHHYLIIPKTHIANAKELKPEDEPLYDKLVDTIDIVRAQRGIDRLSVRTGFHWPPYTTVGHLHLHVIAPVEEMGFVRRLMFKENSFWFVGTNFVKSRFGSVG